MRYLRQAFLLLATILLLVACDSEPTSSYQKGNPYTKEFAGLNGPVKYAVYSYYKKGNVYKAVRDDYSPEGVLTKRKEYHAGDSIVEHYIYDPNNNIQEITGTHITSYKPIYKKGALVKEYIYTDEKKKEGIMYRYKMDGETCIKKQNDIKTRAGITTTFSYNSKGIVQMDKMIQNNGDYALYMYDDSNRLAKIEFYDIDDNLRYKETVSGTYDSYGNCTKYRARRRGKTVTFYKVVYKYYTDKEKGASKVFKASSLQDDDEGYHFVPSSTLLTIIGILSCLILIFYLYYAQQHWALFKHFGGKVEKDGMRKMWMYNKEPYIKMGTIFAAIIAAFFSSILLLLLFGGVVWVIFWIVKIILWATIVIGWILLIGGALVLIGKRSGYGLIGAIVGGLIVTFQGHLEAWGEDLVRWGAQLLDHVNALDWTLTILREDGIKILMVIAIPFGCFLALACLLITCSYLLRAIEFASIKIYNVNRPCPYCGNKKDFDYWVDGKKYPIELRPGTYGVLHQTNHITGVRVPTMLMNGKAKLIRKCPHCQQLINTKQDKTYGTDVHIGIVGDRSSGKSYMLYSSLELLFQKFGKDLQQIDFDNNNNVKILAERIHQRVDIQTAVKSHYKAIQLRLNRKFRPIPYHLFFYDVAGEKFSVNTIKTPSALEFYTNVKTVVFVIDPTMINIDRLSPSDSFKRWFAQNGNQDEQYDLEGTIGSLKEIIEQVGRKTKDIDLILACSKKDLGYLESSNYPYDCDGATIKKYIQEELGLFNLVNSVEPSFKSVGYAAVSAIDSERKALQRLFVEILKQRGVHMD